MRHVFESVGFTVRIGCMFDVCRYAVWCKAGVLCESVPVWVQYRNIQCRWICRNVYGMLDPVEYTIRHRGMYRVSRHAIRYETHVFL